MSVRVYVCLCEMQIKAVEVSLYHCFYSNIGVALFGLIELNDTIQRARKHEIEWILSIASRTTTTATATVTTTATSATTTTISEVCTVVVAIQLRQHHLANFTDLFDSDSDHVNLLGNEQHEQYNLFKACCYMSHTYYM